MAFNQSSTASSTTTNKGDFKKADRFLNLYITGLDGKPIKVSFIGLHADVPHEKAIMDYLDANPDKTGDVISAMTADYRSATPVKAFAGFKFGA